MYDAGETEIDLYKENTRSRTIIVGNNHTVNLFYNPKSHFLFGYKTTLRNKDTVVMLDAFTALGANSVVDIDNETNGRDISWTFSVRGFMTTGCGSFFYDKKGLEDADLGDSEKALGSFMQGVMAAGFCSMTVISNPLEGVMIVGGRSVIKAKKNRGVIIGGIINTNLEQELTEEEQKFKTVSSVVEGEGIFIRGQLRNVSQQELSSGSLIHGSTVVTSPTHLGGSFILDKDFTLKDKDGKTIIFENGQLKSS